MANEELRRFAARMETVAYAALRIVAGALFAFHGLQKLTGWMMQGHHVAVGSQAWFGGIIELVAGGLIAIGLVARCAAFVASGEMAVAYFQFHWKLKFAHWMWLPAANHGELAVLYCFIFLFIACRGSGPVSVDAVIWRRR